MAEEAKDGRFGKWDRDKSTDRNKFCWNCLYWEKAHHEKPCDTCFGFTNTAKGYAYKNWTEGVDYVKD